MVDPDRSRQLRRELGHKAKSAFDRAQSDLLEVAFRADVNLTTVVSARLGRELPEVAYLGDRVVARMSIPDRLRAIGDIMKTEGWDEEFPFVLPTLNRLFEVRNILAHSMAFDSPLARGEDWEVTRWSYRRGSDQRTPLSLKRLRALHHSAERVVMHDLNVLWIRSIPTSYWMEGVEDDS